MPKQTSASSGSPNLIFKKIRIKGDLDPRKLRCSNGKGKDDVRHVLSLAIRISANWLGRGSCTHLKLQDWLTKDIPGNERCTLLSTAVLSVNSNKALVQIEREVLLQNKFSGTHIQP